MLLSCRFTKTLETFHPLVQLSIEIGNIAKQVGRI